MPKITKKTVIIYFVALVAIYSATELIPLIVEKSRSTEVLQYGHISEKADVDLYFIRDEKIYASPYKSKTEYYAKDGRQVKVGQKLISFKKRAGEKTEVNRNSKRHIPFKKVSNGHAEKKGVFSIYADGNEAKFSPKKIKGLSLHNIENLDLTMKKIKAERADKHTAVYKIVDNSKWYMVFWIDIGLGTRFEKNLDVRVKVKGDFVDARVDSIKSENDLLKVVLKTDRYLKNFARFRKVKGKVVSLTKSGLIVKNEFITTKKGIPGVYVVGKTDESRFVPVKVLDSNGSESVVAQDFFYDKKGNICETVKLFDEVFTNPHKP